MGRRGCPLSVWSCGWRAKPAAAARRLQGGARASVTSLARAHISTNITTSCRKKAHHQQTQHLSLPPTQLKNVLLRVPRDCPSGQDPPEAHPSCLRRPWPGRRAARALRANLALSKLPVRPGPAGGTSLLAECVFFSGCSGAAALPFTRSRF